MDKLKIILLTKEIVALYLQNDLNIENITEEIKKQQQKTSKQETTINENLTYQKTKFLCFLFKNIPYYKINYIIEEIQEFIIYIGENDIFLKTHALLINGFLNENQKNISQRIKTEIYAHLYIALQNFYQNNTSNRKQDIIRLQKNMLNPEKMFGLENITNSYFHQKTFINEDLQEETSKKSYNYTMYLKNKLKKRMIKYFTKDSLEEIQKYMEMVINEIPNKLNQILIRDLINNELNNICKNIEPFLENPVNDITLIMNRKK